MDTTSERRVYYSGARRSTRIITLHLPLTPQTKNLITRREMDLMKPDAVLINTSRGGMVDEHELAQALKMDPLAQRKKNCAKRDPRQNRPYRANALSTNPLVCVAGRSILAAATAGSNIFSTS